MQAHKVTIPSDPATNRRYLEVLIAEGAVTDTVFIKMHDIINSQDSGSAFTGGWYTKETLDDLITVLQFARLERFGND